MAHVVVGGLPWYHIERGLEEVELAVSLMCQGSV